MTEELKIGENIGEKHTIPCVRCVGNTRHQVIAAANIHGSEDRHDDCFQWNVTNQLLECGGCGAITYRRASSDTEMMGPDGEYWEDVALYPQRVLGRKRLDDAWMLGPKVQSIYRETADALAAGSPVLAGIGLRAILETVCKEKNAAGANLLAKIDDLVVKGLLTPGGADVLHQIRTLGNDAAHEVKPHNDKQLALAMDVIEHLLTDVYIMKAKAERLLPKAPGGAPAALSATAP